MYLYRTFLKMILLTLSTSAIAAGQTEYPLEINNCGVELKFDRSPRNIVSIGQGATEILYSLGLGDRLAGTALWYSKVLAPFEEQNLKVPRLADDAPTFESVVSKRPGLVAVQFEWMIGAQGMVGTREQFYELGVPTFILPTDCEGKDNAIGAGGTRVRPFAMDLIYKDIEQLAEIFDVQDAGERLLLDIRERLSHIIAGAERRRAQKVSVAFWFSSEDRERDPYVAGTKGAANYIATVLGIRNVVESPEEWPTIGWETIAKANPTFLVVARMDRRSYPMDDLEKKLQFLRTDPVTKYMDAVKNDRIIVIDADGMQASLRLIGALQTVADAVDNFTGNI